MNISSISAISASFGGFYSNTGSTYARSSHGNATGGSATGSKSVNTDANGTTTTTIRGASNDIVSVTTVAPAARLTPAYGPTYGNVPQNQESTVDITA
jgi:hypothetical protein